MATQTKEELIFKIDVDYATAVKNIATYQQKIDELKNTQNELKKQLKEQSISQEEYQKAMAASKIEIDYNKKAINEYNKEIQNNLIIQNAQEGSLKQLKAELSNLTKEYDSMSKAQKIGAEGISKLEKINEITAQLNEAEQASGRFQRNVGNYPQVVTAIIPGFDKLNGFLSGFGSSISELATKGGAGFASLGQSAIAMGKAFITPPIGIIVAVLSAIMLVIQKVKEAFNKNEDATLRMQKAFALLQPVITFIGKLFDQLAVFISKVVEGIAGAIQGVTKLAEFLGFLPKGFGDAAKSAQDLIQAQNDLDDAENKYTVDSAKRRKEISDLADKSVQKDKYTAEQRKGFIQQEMDLKNKDLVEQKKIADEKLRIYKAQADQDKINNAESKRRIAELTAATTDAENTKNEGIKRNLKELQAANAEIDNERKQAAADAKQAAQQAAADAKERHDKEIEAIRQAQDTALALVMEGVQKQRDQLNLSATREIEDLQNKLATENNLTEKAKQAIAETIKNIQDKLVQDLAALDDQAIADRIDKETKRIQLQLDAVRTGTQQEFDLRQQLIEENRQKELQDNMQLAEEKRQDESLINAKYDKQRQDEIDNLNQIILEKKRQSLENEFNESMLLLGNNEIAKAQLQLQYAEQLNQNLLSMDEQTKQKQFKTEEDYNAAIISSRQKVAEETIKINQLQQQQLQNQLSATGQFSSAIGDIMNTLGENNEQYAEFQKLLAIFNIAINTAQAISGAIAAATPGDPYTTAIRIAAAVAAAVAGMAAALTKANSAKQPKAPRFAAGGLITGEGSGTSDSIPAKLSAGESVLTAAATSYFAPMLSAFNQIGGGVPISSNTTVINNNRGTELGEEMLARAFEKGYIRGATKFPPVVSVEELTRVQNQIKVMERLSKLQ